MGFSGKLGAYLSQEICEYHSGKCMSIILCVIPCSTNDMELFFLYVCAFETLIITLLCEC